MFDPCHPRFEVTPDGRQRKSDCLKKRIRNLVRRMHKTVIGQILEYFVCHSNILGTLNLLCSLLALKEDVIFQATQAVDAHADVKRSLTVHVRKDRNLKRTTCIFSTHEIHFVGFAAEFEKLLCKLTSLKLVGSLLRIVILVRTFSSRQEVQDSISLRKNVEDEMNLLLNVHVV